MQDFESIYRVVVRRALTNGDPSLIALHFQVQVLQRYSGAPGFSLIRTDTVGRVSKEGGWSLDFGIAPDEKLIHATVADMLNLPDTERDHWASFAAVLPSSKMLLQMRMAPAACYSDGDVRAWDISLANP